MLRKLGGKKVSPLFLQEKEGRKRIPKGKREI